MVWSTWLINRNGRYALRIVKSIEWHLITSEYPPQPGGVSDYTRLVATGLAAAGDEAHVWCPRAEDAQHTNGKESEATSPAGVFAHREMGRFTPADLRRAGRQLDQFHAPRRLLVQWVPHGYGYQSMNMPFCLWLWHRAARHRDVVEVMVHEPYLAFGEGSWKQSGVAAAHRLMTMILLRAARRVWVSIPAWEDSLRPYAPGRALPFRWLPVASNIAVVDDPDGVREVRARYASAGEQIVGHFGTHDRRITELLLKYAPALLRGRAGCVMLLLGHGSGAARDEVVRIYPELNERVHATGALAPRDLSLYISACDLLAQPYVDGVSSRRTSVMVGLSHGIPIVTTSGRLTESRWAESEAVALAPVEDMAAFVEMTNRLLADATIRHRMSAAARALYRQRFDIERTVAALREAVV
jgi:glycosyltransferase involved in cell wall biosynthesis